MLDNPVYTGYLAPRGDKHGYHDHDISKWTKGNHEPIIPMELFFAVQKKYKKGPRITKHISIFQKLIYCPYCKHNYSFYARQNKNTVKYFYECVPIVSGGKHCYRKIDEEMLENTLIGNIGKLFDTSVHEQSKPVNIEEEIRKIDMKIEKILDLDIEVMPKDKIKKKIEQLQQEKVELLNQQKAVLQKKNINQYFQKIEDIYPYANREERKRLWNIIIQKVAIYDDSVEVFWNNGKKTRHKKVLKVNSLRKVREGGVSLSSFIDEMEKILSE
jgi:hypothetical protein